MVNDPGMDALPSTRSSTVSIPPLISLSFGFHSVFLGPLKLHIICTLPLDPPQFIIFVGTPRHHVAIIVSIHALLSLSTFFTFEFVIRAQELNEWDQEYTRRPTAVL